MIDKFKLLGNRILIQKIQVENKIQGIYVPETSIKPKDRATVIALGDDCDTVIEVGDIVLIDKYIGTEVTIDDESYTIVRTDDVFGVFCK